MPAAPVFPAAGASMQDAVDHLKIMNNALARIGAGGIIAEDDDTDLAEQVAAVYYDRLDAVLGMHEWSFAGKTFRLDAIAEIPGNDYDLTDRKFMNGWRHAFVLPGSRLGAPRKVLADPRCPTDPLRAFLIETGVLYADVDKAWAVCTVRASPIAWDPLFTLGFTMIIASDLCVPVTHDDNLARSLRITAEGTPEEGGRGGLIGRAMASDAAKSRTAAPLWRDELTQAHMS
jgi:hypothetical protein